MSGVPAVPEFDDDDHKPLSPDDIIVPFDDARRRRTREEGEAQPKLPFINMQTWDACPVPEQDWIVRNRLPRRQTTLFSGEGAIGKSTTMLYLSAACTLGRDWLGTCPELGPALFIDAEDEETVVHRRLASIVKHYDVRYSDLISGGLHLISLAGQDAVLATTTRGGKIEPTPLYNLIHQTCGDIKPVVIGMASSANFFAGNEINRSEVQQFVGMLTRLAIVANGSLVLLTHPSLTGTHTNSGLSGSTAWHASVRARFYMRSVKSEIIKDEEADTSDLREIVFKKSNYGPLSENIVLEWRDGMFLPKPGMSPTIVEHAAAAAKADAMFLALLRRYDSEGRKVGHNKGPSYAPAVFAGSPEATAAHITSEMFAAAMERLFQAKAIFTQQYGRPSRPYYQIVITAPVTAKFQIVGPSDEPCEHCGNGGSVYLIRDPFRGVASHALHERCASAFFKRDEEGS
jgi:RecA-family ATPase